MIEAIIHWLLTSWLSIVIATVLAAFGLGATFFRLVPFEYAAIVKWIGRAAFVAAIWLSGYQAADDRARHEAQLQTLRNENARLSRDLVNQKAIAAFASGERDRLKDELGEREKKVADYESELARAEAKRPPTCPADVIDARDLRWRRGLQNNQR